MTFKNSWLNFESIKRQVFRNFFSKKWDKKTSHLCSCIEFFQNWHFSRRLFSWNFTKWILLFFQCKKVAKLRAFNFWKNKIHNERKRRIKASHVEWSLKLKCVDLQRMCSWCLSEPKPLWKLGFAPRENERLWLYPTPKIRKKRLRFPIGCFWYERWRRRGSWSRACTFPMPDFKWLNLCLPRNLF